MQIRGWGQSRSGDGFIRRTRGTAATWSGRHGSCRDQRACAPLDARTSDRTGRMPFGTQFARVCLFTPRPAYRNSLPYEFCNESGDGLAKLIQQLLKLQMSDYVQSKMTFIYIYFFRANN